MLNKKNNRNRYKMNLDQLSSIIKENRMVCTCSKEDVGKGD